MIPPIRREALALRASIDAQEEHATSAAETPGERVELALELSELARQAAESLRASWTTTPPDDLDVKARLYARPLTALVRTTTKTSA
jgi:hypothetical protein